ncbi:MAG TPA: polyphosphate kinase 2 family protein [Thermoanaerobaculia bacterium]|jgi:PPK2 family polyphosphate:nucleotide phosphotransferase|nr:polyphosphate kinase 2 family protein [Thermoanaerobaculia bacterium]
MKRIKLDEHDPAETSGVDKSEAAAANAAIQKRIGELQELLYAEHTQRVLIILQGMDTSGKDGTVRHVMNDCSLQGVRVVSFKKPTEEELEHDYLWRVHKHVPGNGEIAIFNRSHYEDVLVVRVHGDHGEKYWKKRFRQINDFEQMLAENGTTILKFFLHISPEEQRERLESRIADPTKRWKFQHGDIEERKLWKDYIRAYEEAMTETSTEYASWTIVPANRKWFRNYIVGKTVVDTLENLGMQYPEPDLSAERVE